MIVAVKRTAQSSTRLATSPSRLTRLADRLKAFFFQAVTEQNRPTLESMEPRTLMSAMTYDLGDVFQVNTSTTGDQQPEVPVSRNSSGAFVIAWVSPASDGDGLGISARLYGPDGNPVTGEFTANDFTTGNQVQPFTAIAEDGSFVIGWRDGGSTSTFARHFDNSGKAIDAGFEVDDNAIVTQAAITQDGTLVTVGHALTHGPLDPQYILVNRFDTAGTQIGSTIHPNTSTTGAPWFPALDLASDGSFVVTWENGANGALQSVMARRYDTLGQPIGSDFAVNDDTVNSQRFPDIARAADGSFVVVWQGAGAADNAGIYARRYDSAGNPAADAFLVNASTTGTQIGAHVWMGLDGRFVVVWGNQEAQTASARVFDPAGTPVGSDILIASDAYILDEPRSVRISHDSTGTGATITWAGPGPIDRDIFARTITTNLPPVVAFPIPDVSMTVGDPSISIDLTAYFQDAETADKNLVFTLVSSSNPLAGGAILTGSVLDLGTFPLAFGNTTITVRATDEQGAFVDSSLSLSIERRPDSLLVTNGPSVIANQTTSGVQTAGSVTYLADGSFVMVWEGAGAGDVSAGVWARHFDSLGAPITDEFAVSTSTGTGSRVAASPSGGFVVTWENGDIHGQVYDASASKVGSTFAVNTYTTSTQSWNSATYLSDGSFVVSWTSVAQAAGSTGVYTRRFDSSGAPVTSEMLVGLGTANTFAQVATHPDGGYAVIWDNASNSAKGQIFLQRYSPADATVGSLVIVSQSAAYGQARPSVAFQPDGTFMATWLQTPQDYLLNDNIFGRFFSSQAVPVGDQFTVFSTYNTLVNPQVVAIPGAGYTVAWSEYIGASTNTNFQVYGTNLAKIGPRSRVGTFSDYHTELSIRPAVSPAGHVLFAWTNALTTGSSSLDAAFEPYVWGTAPYTTSSLPPVIAAEGDAPIVIDVSPYFADHETSGDKLTYSASAGASGIVSVSVSGSILTITLGENRSGETSITVTAQDEQMLTVSASMSVQVTESDNDTPVATPIPDVTVSEDSAPSYTNLSPYFSDPETPSHSLTYSILSSTISGFATAELVYDSTTPGIPSGRLKLVYLPNASGQGDVTIRATDQAGAYVDSVVHVVVNPVNDLPVLAAIPPVQVNENSPAVQIDLRGYASDIEDSFDSLTFSVLSVFDPGVVDATISDGILTLTFAPGTFGLADTTIRVTDSQGGYADQTVGVSVVRDPSRQLGSSEPAQVVNKGELVNQFQSDISVAPDGSYVIVWATRTSSSHFNIFGRQFDADGTPLTGEFLVRTFNSGSAFNPRASHAPDGSFVVVWDGAGATDTAGIFAQRFDASAGKVGGEFLINSTGTSFAQVSPSIAHSSTGAFVVSYTSEYSTGSGTAYGIFAIAFDASGTRTSINRTIASTVTSSSTSDIAYADTGLYTVVWASGSSKVAGNIQARQINADTTFFGSSFDVNSTVGLSQAAPRIDVAPSGDFVVTWSGLNPSGSSDFDIFAQRFLPSTSKDGGQFVVNSTTSGNQYASRVSVGPQGDFVIGWTTYSGTGSTGALFQAYDSDGNKVGFETRLGALYGSVIQELGGIEFAGNDKVITSYAYSPSSNVVATLYTRQYEWFFAPALTGQPAINISEDSGTTSIDLAPYFYDPNTPASSLTFTYAGNSNVNLVTAKVVDGSLILTTKDNTSGTVNISIRATSATGVAFIGKLTVNILSVDDPITWVDAGSVTVTDKSGSGSINLAKYVQDVDSPVPPLTFTIDAVSNTNPLASSAVNGNFLDFALTGTSGVVYFTVTASDGSGNKATGIIQLTIVDTTPPTVTAFNNPPAPTIDPVGSIDIQFSEAISLGSFSWQDLTLTRDGGPNLITAGSGITLTLVSGTTYRISGLSPLNLAAGAYTLTLVNGSVSDNASNLLAGAASAVWTRPTPQVMNLSQYPSPRTTPVTSVAVRLSQPASLATFTWEDIQLTLDNGANLATSGITITQSGTDPSLFTINIPASLTTGAGAYKLTVEGSGIQSSAGLAFGNSNFTTWTMLPIITGLTQPVSSITPVTSVKVKLNTTANLATFSWQDLSLTRDGGANLITSGTGISIAQSGIDPLEYTITLPSSLTSAVGAYSLTVTGAGITAASGPAFANTASTTWARLPEVMNLSAFTAPRTTPVSSVAVRLSHPADLATFTWADVRITLNNGANLVTSISGLTVAVSGWDPNVYVITIPSSLTQAAGDYKLTVVGANITSAAGLKYGNDSFTTWTMVPQVMNLSQFTSPRTAPVTSVAVRLSSLANLATFNWQDLTLTRDSGANLATSAITIAQSTWDVKVYVITLPGALTTAPGVYTLTVLGAGITAQEGLAFGNNSATTWTMI